MPAKENILSQFDSVFSEMESQLNGSIGSLVHEFQKKSFNTLKQIQFPDRKHEDWKYTSVLKLIEPDYKIAGGASGEMKVESIPGLESYVIEVINGKIVLENCAPALRSSGIRINTLNEAFGLNSWKEVFLHWISQDNHTSNRAFEFLNYAFHANSFFIEIPKHVVLDKPIEIRITHTDPGITFSHPLYFIRACEGSNATIFERFENNVSDSNSSVSLVNSLGYIHLDQNASIKHIKWQHLPTHQNLVYKLLVTQRRDSRFESLAFDFGGAIVRNNVEVELDESNTYTSLQAGFIAKDRQSMDHQTRINHKVPYCESHELYKGIIDGYASAAFNGKVLVHKDAQKTNAYQQNDTLVLSPNALMNSKPQLEIFADDVKCSHGATIGQMDESALFYLRSRGMNIHEAKHVLKSAFLASVIEHITDPNIRQHISTGMSTAV